MKLQLNESIDLPKEGFFWIIDDKIVGYSEEVQKYNHELKKSVTHEELWEKIKDKYDNKEFNYYPRGRVMVDPEYDSNGTFDGFVCMIFIDPCIDTESDKNKIINYYNLNLKSMKHIMWMGNLKERAGLNHYSCNKCREKNK